MSSCEVRFKVLVLYTSVSARVCIVYISGVLVYG